VELSSRKAVHALNGGSFGKSFGEKLKGVGIRKFFWTRMEAKQQAGNDHATEVC
jgi:hypothetical protein